MLTNVCRIWPTVNTPSRNRRSASDDGRMRSGPRQTLGMQLNLEGPGHGDYIDLGRSHAVADKVTVEAAVAGC